MRVNQLTPARAKLTVVDRIINVLLGYLFDHEDRHWNKQVHDLIRQHDEIMVKTGDQIRFGFLYAGEAYRHPESPYRGNQLRGLHLSLVPEMNTLLKDRAIFVKDRVEIRQALFGLISPVAEVLPDLRNALPECLVKALPELVAIPRTGEPASFLEQGTSARKLYDKNKEKMEAYAATRLIY